jgi:hypothetical protein
MLKGCNVKLFLLLGGSNTFLLTSCHPECNEGIFFNGMEANGIFKLDPETSSGGRCAGITIDRLTTETNQRMN